MLVKELKEILKNVPDNLEIGTTGHFGEFFETDKFEFYEKEIEEKVDFGKWQKRKIFHIPAINIGESPD